MAQAQANVITLRGSAAIIAEFFGYAVNNILYQRGIYPADSFEARKKYGLSIMIASDDGLTKYLGTVLTQISDWMEQGSLQKLVLVISSLSSSEVLERWTFDIRQEVDKDGVRVATSDKPEKEIQSEIAAIIRQITASVTFLPLIEEACSFDLLVYADKHAEVPKTWEDSDPRYITDSAEVKLRSFSTKVHRVESMVAYKRGG